MTRDILLAAFLSLFGNLPAPPPKTMPVIQAPRDPAPAPITTECPPLRRRSLDRRQP